MLADHESAPLGSRILFPIHRLLHPHPVGLDDCLVSGGDQLAAQVLRRCGITHKKGTLPEFGQGALIEKKAPQISATGS